MLHYLKAAGEPGTIPAGAYDISNGQQPTYAELIRTYAASRQLRRLWLPFPPVPPRLVATIASWLTPLPRELTADLSMSLPNTMDSHDTRIRELVPDPPDGLISVDAALTRSLTPQHPAGVYATDDALHLTTTDPRWAG